MLIKLFVAKKHQLSKMSKKDDWLSATWYIGTGGQDEMFANADAKKHSVYLEMTHPYSTSYTQRSFASYSSWLSAIKHTSSLLENRRYLNEIIRAGSPHRFYLDIEIKQEEAKQKGIPWPIDVNGFINEWTPRIAEIIRSEFRTEVPKEHFYYTSAAVETKFSIHLTIDHRDNEGKHVLSKDMNHSKWLLTRLIHTYPEFGPFSDTSVYKRNQKMRMIWSAKPHKNNTLRPVGDNVERVAAELAGTHVTEPNAYADFEHCIFFIHISCTLQDKHTDNVIIMYYRSYNVVQQWSYLP